MLCMNFCKLLFDIFGCSIVVLSGSSVAFKPGAGRPACAWFLRIGSVRERWYTCVCVCICACVSAPGAINN